jgi:hypothetical protein
VPYHCPRHIHQPEASLLGAQAPIQIFSIREEALVEQANLFDGRPAEQEGAGRYEIHIDWTLVVQWLVLTLPAVRRPESDWVEPSPGIPDPTRSVSVQHGWTHSTDSRIADQLLHQPLQTIGSDNSVIVKDPECVDAARQSVFERAVISASEPQIIRAGQ